MRSRGLHRLALLALLAMMALVPVHGAEDRLAARRERILADPGAPGLQGLYRELAIEALVAKRLPEGLDALVSVFTKALKSKKDVPTEGELAVLLRVSDAFLLMADTQEYGAEVIFRRDVAEWLFGSEGRLRAFLDMITPQDNRPEVYRIVETLYDHDPKGRDDYRRLILALALVWDQPRPQPHPQMGQGQLPFAGPIAKRYDYFHDLYASKRADIPYARLSVAALTSVIDTPVPLAELEWVRQNVRPTNWERKFFDIRYDERRLEREAYQWPHGPYTLEAIKERGGICTDQAYYATLCARAYGVPALLFVGEGRRGGHAWYGYMKGTEKWEMDIGRYTYDKLAVGYARNSQTNQLMSDHELSFLCDRALHDDDFSDAARLGRLAFVLWKLGYLAGARQTAERSLEKSPLYELPWTVQEEILKEAQDWRGLADLLARQATACRRYPDLVASVNTRQAEALRKLGDDTAADRLLKRNVRNLDDDRDDLARSLVSEQVRIAYEKGDYPGARVQMENLLKDQKQEGQKLAGLLDGYLKLTLETKQTAEAVRFLKHYLDTLGNLYGEDERNRAVFLNLMLRAYENDGDQKEAARVRQKLDRLRR
jgi:tetratricopeptide (TPR) repeat protein